MLPARHGFPFLRIFPLCAFKTMSAAMTCVSQDLTSIGKHAVELLLKRIHGDYTDFPKIDMLDVVFHPRRSVKDLSEHNSTASGKD